MEKFESQPDMINVTIVLPVYNGEEYLEQCIESALSQTLKELELLCVDDGSTDNSAQIIRTFAERDRRVRLLQQNNQGPGPAKNLALRYARGKYISFLDADDYYLDINALEKMVMACEEKNVLICASLRKTLINGEEEKNELFQKTVKNQLLSYYDYQLDYDYQSYLFQRKFLLENNCFFPSYHRYEDPVFLAKTLLIASKFIVADTYLYCYRRPLAITRFTSEKTYDLLRGIEDNLMFSVEYKLKILFRNTVHRLENEYMDIILKTIPLNNLDILYLLLRINQIVCKQKGRNTYIIRPLRGMLICANGYEKHLLKKIRQREKIVLYGAGWFGRNFFLYLKKYNLEQKITAFIVSTMDGNTIQIENVPVIPLDKLEKTEDNYILVTVAERMQNEIKKKLDDGGYKNYEIIDETFLCMTANIVNSI